MPPTQEEFTMRFLTDATFRDVFKQDPKATMVEWGLNVPEGVDIKVVESTPTTHYVVLPPLQGDELDEDQLEMVQAGTSAAAARVDPGFTLMTHNPYC